MRPSESAEPDAHRETADRPRVLVVVDERQVRVMLARGLERAGYRVVEASSAEQAVHLLQTTPIEAAILDVRLSGPTSGLDVLAELRRQPDMAHTPALVLTGGTLDDDEQRTVMKHRAFLFYKLEGINTMLDFLSQLTGHRPAR